MHEHGEAHQGAHWHGDSPDHGHPHAHDHSGAAHGHTHGAVDPAILATARGIWAVVVASVVGFLGNEAVAVFRIKVGKEIGSAALVTDGYHARVDGGASLAVLFGAIGVWLGYPLADPIVGLLITLAIFKIVWDSRKPVFMRLLDGVEPEVVDEIRAAASQWPEVKDVTEVRVRWLGHRLIAELNVAVSPHLSVAEGHEIAVAVEQQLLTALSYLSRATIHVDPLNQSGAEHHHSAGHMRGDDLTHSDIR